MVSSGLSDVFSPVGETEEVDTTATTAYSKLLPLNKFSLCFTE